MEQLQQLQVDLTSSRQAAKDASVVAAAAASRAAADLDACRQQVQQLQRQVDAAAAGNAALKQQLASEQAAAATAAASSSSRQQSSDRQLADALAQLSQARAEAQQLQQHLQQDWVMHKQEADAAAVKVGPHAKSPQDSQCFLVYIVEMHCQGWSCAGL